MDSRVCPSSAAVGCILCVYEFSRKFYDRQCGFHFPQGASEIALAVGQNRPAVHVRLPAAILSAGDDIEQSKCEAPELYRVYFYPADVDEFSAAYFGLAAAAFQ